MSRWLFDIWMVLPDWAVWTLLAVLAVLWILFALALLAWADTPTPERRDPAPNPGSLHRSPTRPYDWQREHAA